MKKLYLFYKINWDSIDLERELRGAVLADNEDTAKWIASISKIPYDEIDSVNQFQDNPFIFKVEE